VVENDTVVSFQVRYLQLSDTNAQIRLIKSIRNVPSQWPKLFPLLDKSMEEANPVQELLPDLHNSSQ